MDDKRSCIEALPRLHVSCLLGDIFNNLIAKFCSDETLMNMLHCGIAFSDSLTEVLISRSGFCFDMIRDWDVRRINLVKCVVLFKLDDVTNLSMVPNVTHICMCDNNADTIIWPKKLERLCINQPLSEKIVPGSLPRTLKVLTFPIMFNKQLLPGMLPEKLECLYFNSHFDRELVQDTFPGSIKHLRFGHSSMFSHKIEPGILPNGLETLELGINYEHELEPGVLPSSLRSFKIRGACKTPIRQNILPPNLRRLLMRPTQILMGTMPTNLTEVNLECDNPFGLFVLRPKLLPDSVIKLTLRGYFNQACLDFSFFPSNLLELEFGCIFNQILLPETLPKKLTSLNLGAGYNMEIPIGALPNKLEKLTFGTLHQKFNQPLKRRVLPASLQSLDVGMAFRFYLTRGVLPVGLRVLHVSSEHPDKKTMNTQSLMCPLVKIVLIDHAIDETN